jgi:hypothetical protein
MPKATINARGHAIPRERIWKSACISTHQKVQSVGQEISVIGFLPNLQSAQSCQITKTLGYIV